MNAHEEARRGFSNDDQINIKIKPKRKISFDGPTWTNDLHYEMRPGIMPGLMSKPKKKTLYKKQKDTVKRLY